MIEFGDDEEGRIVRLVPPDFNFGDDKETILLESYPTSDADSSIFAFSITDCFCYVYSTKHDGRVYSVVIVSDQPTPLFYFEFLEDLDNVIHSGVDLIPNALMEVVISIVGNWKIVDQRVSIAYMQKSFRYLVDDCPAIQPFRYMEGEYSFTRLWRCLLSGGRILIVGSPSNTRALSRAFFGVIYLSRFIPYRENVLLVPNPRDPRIESDLSKYKVVATTSSSVSGDGFNIVMRLQSRTTTENNHLEGEIVRRNDRLRLFVAYLIQREMAADPYAELLRKPLVTDDLRADISVDMMRQTITFEELKEFSNLKSLALWRENVVESGFRDGFLSWSPEEALANKTHDELVVISQQMETLAAKFENDLHMTLVIGKHQRLIQEKLRQ